MDELFKKVVKGYIERIPPNYSNDLMKFISCCL